MKTQINMNSAYSMNNGGIANPPKIPGAKKTKSLMALQLIYGVDGTGSSSAFANGITTIQQSLAIDLPTLMMNINFGQCVIRDLDYDGSAAIVMSLQNATAEEAIQAAAIVDYNGGGDEDESFFDGLEYILDNYPLSYATGTRRAILILASSSSKDTRSGKGVAEMAKDFLQKNVTLLVVATPGSNLHELAKQANGLSFTLSDTPSAAEIAQVSQRLTASLSQGNPSAGTVPSPTSYGLNGTLLVSP
jgi:hypothetical protein